jgi:hypothetical protein
MRCAGSYPKSYNLGNKNLEGFFASPIYVQEKVDGSQFSFGCYDGGLRCWSKSHELDLANPGMFAPATTALLGVYPLPMLALTPGWTYRGEFLAKPRHNKLTYGRVPRHHVILFDIQDENENWLTYADVRKEADRLGFDVATVYMLWNNQADTVEYLVDEVKHLVATTTSVLGDAIIEGVVLKSYQRDGGGFVVFGKYVRPEFREEATPRKARGGTDDFLASLANAATGPMRWTKAAQRLRDEGLLEGAMQDMPGLIQEIKADIYLDCAADFKDALLAWALPKMTRHFIQGLAEWYKARLLEQAVETAQHG